MSLLTYGEVRPWARAIKDRVVSLEMPPWHIDRTVGIQSFKNDRSLRQEQIDTIVKWVDGGAPLGDRADLPPPVEWPDPEAWRLSDRFGAPDLVVASAPYTVAADGQDKWWKPLAETGLTDERWVKAIEIKPSFPGGRKVVHHAIARLLQEEEGVTGLANSVDFDDDIGPGTFMEWAVGKEGEIFPDDAGKLMMALNIEQTERDLRGAIDYLLSCDEVAGGRVGTVGFCMGGQLSLFAACANPKVGACVDFYGIHPNVTPDLASLQAPVLGFFAEKDGFVTPEVARKLEADLRAAGKEVEVTIFDGADHAFFNDTRAEVYHAAYAAECWTRMLAFYRRHLA
jgi:carboxymethylenebutenolidase